MNHRVLKVLIGFQSLSDSERQEFLEKIIKLKALTFSEQDRMLKSYEDEISLGPMNRVGCPCCGK